MVLAAERFSRNLHSKNLERYRVSYRDEFVVDPMLLWDGQVARQRVVDAGIVSPDYRTFKVREGFDPAFLEYLLRSAQMRARYKLEARGTNVRRSRIARSDFLALTIPAPPLEAQRKIATILASVDDAVATTNAVIEQLKVVRKALMAELLTCGLPRRHMRFRQADIGRIPADWKTDAVDAIASTYAGGTPSRSKPEYYGGDIPWVKSGEVDNPCIQQTEEAITDLGMRDSAAKWVEAGSVLIAMYGATAGKVGRLAIRATTNQAVCAICGDAEKVRNDFLYHALNHAAPELLRACQGSGQPNLNAGMIRALQVPLPPLDEQHAIAILGDTLLERLTSEYSAATELLNFKSALVSALLSGIIHVPLD